MAKIRFGYSDDFTAKNSSVGINTTEPQQNLDVDGVVKGQDLKVTGISSLTAYEGFLRADHQIAENTTLTFDQGPVSSLSGEIIVGTGQTVTVSKVDNEFANANDGTVWSVYLTNSSGGFQAAYPASNAFNGKISATETSRSVTSQITSTWTPPKAITYSSSVEVWTYYAGSVSLNGGTAITVSNDQSWRKIGSGSGTLTSITFSSNSGNSVYIAGIAIDGEILVDGFSTLVDKGARAGGSEIECLKVFNTFTPPNGGTNERPYAPKPGELYYNYDFKTIEFFDGNGWRQVDNTTTSSRAVFAGGYAPGPSYATQSSMTSVNITSTGNALDFGSLVANARTDHGALSSSIRGIWHQSIGDPSAGESLDYIALASGGQAADFGDMNTDRTRSSALSSSTRGLIAGGYAHPARVNAIDYIQISTVGNALDFGDLSSHGIRNAPIASPTKGVFVGGTPAAATRTNEITFVTIASKGNSIDFGGVALFSGSYSAGGVSNGVRGIYGGGDIAGGTGKEKSIGYLNLASTGNSQYFGDLSIAGSHHCGTSNATRGIFNSSDQAPNSAVYTNAIEYITISTAGNSIDFGDDVINAGRRACTSDSHGGLGGF